MTIFEYNRPRSIFLSSFLRLDEKMRINSIIVILIGVFLLPKTAHLSTITPERIIELTNAHRADAGLETLVIDTKLEEAAKAKAAAILESQNFNHTIADKRFSSWVKESGYEYSLVGENLAIDFVTSEGVLKAWLESPAHKKNILNEEYSEIGTAVLEGQFQGQNTIIVAQIFGTPIKAETAQAAETIPAASREIEDGAKFDLRALARLAFKAAPSPLNWLPALLESQPRKPYSTQLSFKGLNSLF